MLAGVALILLAVLLPLSWNIARARRERRVRADMRVLVGAGYSFFRHYQRWPGTREPGGGDTRYGLRQPNCELVAILRGLETESDFTRLQNPERREFLRLPPARPGASGLDASGNYVDVWGEPYQAVMDANLDGICEIEDSAHGEKPVAGGMAVWSSGPDRRPETEDDVLSWDRKAGK